MPGGPLTEILNLNGKVAIVTGAAKGIGYGIAARFKEAGATTVMVDVDRATGEKRAADLGAEFIAADLSSEAEAHRVISETISRAGCADILVNNAGIYPFRPALEMTAAEWDRVQNLNLRGLFLLSKEFVNATRDRGEGGAIVNIGSIDSLHPSSAGLAAYDASKGGVLMFTKSFALEVAPLGYRVNMIAPGGITTEGVSSTQANVPSDVMDTFLARIPLGRWGEPDDIALMALVLCTPLSAYVTGETIVVDGGRLLS